MNLELITILILTVAAVLAVRRLALVSPKDACRYMAEGALIVDVRNPEEFSRGHVPGAVNLPLSTLPGNLSMRVPDKAQVLLVYCLGGGRSAIAKWLLRRHGYPRAFNVGSYRRAERIARAGLGKIEPAVSHSPPTW